ncbi:MAG TPA: 50S ribosomal protein L15 [Saprospiraceae bacterium]|nr:50S ribosomal protein L15 [Saprospiraceae bacterium]MCB9329205.1 50S ribosomal protein L15 [Lewinellaceae bacterium]HPK10302.1 50S ribosomal protein L15 [Saprospiraceae bacterium]HPQ21548.1 50S ribosomal protein L15 [Saprospiraceae bacterium]
MRLHSLRPAEGSTKNNFRKGRGRSSGNGKTAGRGHKGAKSVTGYKSKRAFEGGQMPIQMRLPKRGFKNINRVEYVPINVANLQAIVDKHGITEVTTEALYKLGYVKKNDLVKVLGNGEISAGVKVNVNAISASAKAKIEAAGGSVIE